MYANFGFITVSLRTFRRFGKIAKRDSYIRHVALSVHPSAYLPSWKNSAAAVDFHKI
jgi:hypothetical protein